MKTPNIERNKLDYILTDLLPVEITELFSLNHFYNYLMDNRHVLDEAEKVIRKTIEEGNKLPFEKGWATMPLKFNILKGNDGQREISLMQPLSMINIYLFLEFFQKEILILLKEKSVFSLRYHRKNNDLYYRKRIKRISEYYQSTAKKIDKGVLQQTGAYFRIAQYNSVASFTGSRMWQQLNFKYGHFARMDYKSCFNSIYTHSYKWIIQKNIVDSKEASNPNLFAVIDRVLQNTNGKSTNGVIVGPEFSRMIVEILLQQIDIDVLNKLSSFGLEKDRDYNIYRYVDDIFIFAKTEADIDTVIHTITDVSQKYLLQPNELKLIKTTTPFTLNHWLSRTRDLADKVSSLFYTSKELAEVDEGERHLVKGGYLAIEKIKNDFNALVCDFPKEKRTIVSFILSTLLNNISKKKDGTALFKQGSENQAFHILELALYILGFCPCFEHTQRLISIIVYFIDELHFLSNEVYHEKLQRLFIRYMFILQRGNLADLCNLILLFSEYCIVMDTETENLVLTKAIESNNPLILGNYLIYSKYYPSYHREVLDMVEKVIDENIDQITVDEEMLQREFWYVLVFSNCPFLSASLKTKMESIIQRIQRPGAKNPNQMMINLVCDYLLTKQNNLFFTWGAHTFSVTKQIAFRTYQRSLFREYKNRNSLMLYGSLD